MKYACNKDTMLEKIRLFSEIGNDGRGGITRYSLSAEAVRAKQEFIRSMKKIGAKIYTDDLTDIYAVLEGSDSDAKRICMGSHVDSVKNGGNYDGILGVISAMEVLETIAKNNIPHHHPIAAVIWTNEEGSLYSPVMMCSGIVCHDYLPADIQKSYDPAKMMRSVSMEDHHTTFESQLRTSGLVGDISNRMSPDNTFCNFEVHIEQGPILEDAAMDLGIVDCVLGMYNYRIRLYGQTTHAGTFPMSERNDAMYAAARVLICLHEQIDRLNIPDLVYTTGEASIHPDINTCVPDYFDFSFDVRHKDTEALDKVAEIVESLPDTKWCGCRCEVERIWKRDTVFFNKTLAGFADSAAAELGIKHRLIHSGAGHDSQFIAYMVPAAMIFAPSKNGLSHCDGEYTSPEQCTYAASVMLNAVLKADAEEYLQSSRPSPAQCRDIRRI